jgi:hypothetical protein
MSLAIQPLDCIRVSDSKHRRNALFTPNPSDLNVLPSAWGMLGRKSPKESILTVIRIGEVGSIFRSLRSAFFSQRLVKLQSDNLVIFPSRRDPRAARFFLSGPSLFPIPPLPLDDTNPKASRSPNPSRPGGVSSVPGSTCNCEIAWTGLPKSLQNDLYKPSSIRFLLPASVSGPFCASWPARLPERRWSKPLETRVPWR